MIVTVHVDNNACFANVHAPSIGGGVADPCCGILKYHNGATVSLAWEAKHPHGFAHHGLRVMRGEQDVIVSGSVPVNANSSPQSYGVDFLMTRNPHPDCTGSEACSVAGFVADLDVYALATDGWNRQSGLDGGHMRTFVLSRH